MNRPHRTPFLHPLRRGLGGITAHLLGERSVLGESLLKRRGHGVPLHQRDPLDQVLFLFWAGGELVEVDEHAEVVALLGGCDVGAVFPREHFLCAVLHQFGEAFYVDADEDLRFGRWGGDVEGYVVEVGDDLVD